MILSNGYSIATYPQGALNQFEKGLDLSKVEKTWGPMRTVEDSVNRGTDHDVGPDRPMLELELEKIQYRFLDAVKVDGGIRQFYHHYGPDDELDTILELYWTEFKEDAEKIEIEHAPVVNEAEDAPPKSHKSQTSGTELHSHSNSDRD